MAHQRNQLHSHFAEATEKKDNEQGEEELFQQSKSGTAHRIQPNRTQHNVNIAAAAINALVYYYALVITRPPCIDRGIQWNSNPNIATKKNNQEEWCLHFIGKIHACQTIDGLKIFACSYCNLKTNNLH